VQEAVDFAEANPWPAPAEALEDLYAPQPPRAGVNGHPVAGSTTGDGLGKR